MIRCPIKYNNLFYIPTIYYIHNKHIATKMSHSVISVG